MANIELSNLGAGAIAGICHYETYSNVGSPAGYCLGVCPVLALNKGIIRTVERSRRFRRQLLISVALCL